MDNNITIALLEYMNKKNDISFSEKILYMANTAKTVLGAILVSIEHGDGKLSYTKLTEITGLSRPTISILLAQLEDEKFIVRTKVSGNVNIYSLPIETLQLEP